MIKQSPLQFLISICAVLVGSCAPDALAQNEVGNPILPGYFADPTIKKFGDTYYIYSTTDGVKLASGEPQVWMSKDLVNWVNKEMILDLPEGLTNCWAPDVQQADDGMFYYFMGNCQFGCNIYAYKSENPTGPWSKVNNGEPVIPVGSGKDRLPALDAQFFKDDDGKVYSFYGTWCTSFGGMGWGLHDAQAEFKMVEQGFIPIDQIPNAFEAAYMIKRDSIYFLMYSAGDCRLDSYSLHYAWSRNPTGPFTYGKNNPILVSQGTMVDGPGHHSVLEEGDEAFVFYHRHDNPHSSGGEFRQVCVSKMEFEDAHTIAKIDPLAKTVLPDQKSAIKPGKNLALNAKVTASSTYHLLAPPNRYNPEGVDFVYQASHITDGDQGSMWKAGSAELPQSLEIDLGKIATVRQIQLSFEYVTYYYCYKIEVSPDGKTWEIFADRTGNRTPGSPMIDMNVASVRFIKITITGTEKVGMYPAIWSLQVLEETHETFKIFNREVPGPQAKTSGKSLLVDLIAEPTAEKYFNKGSLNGYFSSPGKAVPASTIDEVETFVFNGKDFLKFSSKAPDELSWNAPFTAAAWVYNPEIGGGECLSTWTSRENMLQASYAALMYGKGHYGAAALGDGAVDVAFGKIPEAGRWHHMVMSFDGMVLKIFVDGEVDVIRPMNLFTEAGDILVGASGQPEENFTGYIHRFQLFDYFMDAQEIASLYQATKPSKLKY